jgi:hypothetical protein
LPNWVLYVAAGVGLLFMLPLAFLAWVSLMELALNRWLEWRQYYGSYRDFLVDRINRKRGGK